MKLFWSVTGALLAGLLGLAAAGTYLVQNQPLVLTVAAVTPDLVQLRANTPIASAQLTQAGITAETYGADVYLQPEAYLTPGQTYSFVFDRITNRFGTTTTDVPVTFTVPDTLHYFLSNDAQLGHYNEQTETTTLLTPAGFLVNEYAVAGDDVYLLGIKKDTPMANVWDVTTLQGLYKWSHADQKLTQVLSAKKWNMQGLRASPDGQALALYKAPSNSYAPPQLWLYDTTTQTWQTHWHETFGAGNPVHFSPDNAWLLGVDLATNGYSLSPVQEGADVIPIGNYYENIGISDTGRYLLFKTYTDEDVFNGALEFVLFDNNGASENILSDTALAPEILSFDPTDAVVWFTYTDDQGVAQIGRYDIATSTTQRMTQFTDEQRIVSLRKPRHTNVLLYSVKERTIALQNTDNPQDLLDSYFARENAPTHRVWKYDLTSEQANPLFDGLFLGR